MKGPMFLLVVLMGYFVPALVARHRDHNNATAIAVMNLFLGWTAIGWVIALIWACSDNTKANTARFTMSRN